MVLLIFPLIIIICAFSNCNAQSNNDFAPVPKPLIQWKYGWQDGMKANTIGSASHRDSLPKGTSYLNTGYAPTQIAQAYGFDLISTNGDGSGQTIAIVVAYGNTNIQHDLDVFCNTYHLPTTTLQIYYPNGMPIGNDAGWASETSLDVEWAHAMAPGATIALIVDADSSGTDQAVDFAVTNLNAKIISMSYGNPDYPLEAIEDSYFQSPGVAYVAAAGDSKGEVDYPACSPNVIAVGGTRLLMNTNTGAFTESAWSYTGGGLSAYEAIPSYQAGKNVNPSRGIPDVSAVADTYTGLAVYFTDPTTNDSGGWIVSGGTSASTPIWSAIMARRSSLGFSNDNFHKLIYSKQSGLWPCKDITSGASAYPAVKGYDLATGLGSPRADQIVILDTNSTSVQMSQTITFPAIPRKTFKNPPFKIFATSTSKLPVLFSVISGPATITKNRVTITGGGKVMIAASQEGNLTYDSAHEVTNSFFVNPIPQFIVFPSLGIRRFSTNPITLTAKASSKLPITYSLVSGPASVSNNTVTPTGVGTIVVSAMQSGNASYLPATNKQMSFKIFQPIH